jgi:hypothetical protein
MGGSYVPTGAMAEMATAGLAALPPELLLQMLGDMDARGVATLWQSLAGREVAEHYVGLCLRRDRRGRRLVRSRTWPPGLFAAYSDVPRFEEPTLQQVRACLMEMLTGQVAFAGAAIGFAALSPEAQQGVLNGADAKVVATLWQSHQYRALVERYMTLCLSRRTGRRLLRSHAWPPARFAVYLEIPRIALPSIAQVRRCLHEMSTGQVKFARR